MGHVLMFFRKGWKDSKGLSDNSISCIIEDKDEYVFWIGTIGGGLNRFDHINRETRYFEISENERIESKRISVIHQINSDTLLVGTDFSGLYFFHVSTESFERIDYTIPNTRIYDIKEEAQFYGY